MSAFSSKWNQICMAWCKSRLVIRINFGAFPCDIYRNDFAQRTKCLNISSWMVELVFRSFWVVSFLEWTAAVHKHTGRNVSVYAVNLAKIRLICSELLIWQTLHEATAAPPPPPPPTPLPPSPRCGLTCKCPCSGDVQAWECDRHWGETFNFCPQQWHLSVLLGNL